MGQKTDRLQLRLDLEQRALLEAASAETSTSLSAFVLSSATIAARNVLADRTTFRLSPDQWAAFDQMMNRPAEVVPGLAELMNTPTVLDNDQ